MLFITFLCISFKGWVKQDKVYKNVWHARPNMDYDTIYFITCKYEVFTNI